MRDPKIMTRPNSALRYGRSVVAQTETFDRADSKLKSNSGKLWGVGLGGSDGRVLQPFELSGMAGDHGGSWERARHSDDCTPARSRPRDSEPGAAAGHLPGERVL